MTAPGTLWAPKAIQPRASPFGTGTGERIEQLASARGCADSVENVIIAWSAVEKKALAWAARPDRRKFLEGFN